MVSVVVDSLFIVAPIMFVGVLCLVCFVNAVLSILSSFAIIMMGKRELVAFYFKYIHVYIYINLPDVL